MTKPVSAGVLDSMTPFPALVIALSISTILPAQTDTPDPHALLEAAREACLSLRGVRYRARYEEFGVRHAAGVTVCEVHLARPEPESGMPPRFLVRGTRTYAGRTTPMQLHAGFDGEVVRRVRTSDVLERRFDDLAPGQQAWAIAAGELGAGGNGAVFWSFVNAAPMNRELRNRKAEYEGRAAVDNVLCDVIYLPGETAHDGDRLFLGVDDHLPRKVEHISVMYTDRITGSLLTMTDLKVDPDVHDADYRVPIPAGFDLALYEEPVRGGSLLPVGSIAPDWTLLDPNGNETRLADLRGKVVILDFWGTWCGPCVRKLPDLQELHESLGDQPVEVLALSAHEPPNAKPRQLMDRNGCEVPLLLNAETMVEAYGVTTFPTVYVIGADGQVLFRAIGGAPSSVLRALVLEHLRGDGPPILGYPEDLSFPTSCSRCRDTFTEEARPAAGGAARAPGGAAGSRAARSPFRARCSDPSSRPRPPAQDPPGRPWHSSGWRLFLPLWTDDLSRSVPDFATRGSSWQCFRHWRGDSASGPGAGIAPAAASGRRSRLARVVMSLATDPSPGLRGPTAFRSRIGARGCTGSFRS